MKINLFNETNTKFQEIDLNRIEEVFNKSFKPSRVLYKASNIIIVTAKRITELNKKLFKSSLFTDVIAVPNPQKGSKNIGDIYICPEVIFENAKKYNVSYNEELNRVIIHGILHLLGYDHKKPFGKSKEMMFKLQEQLLEKIK